MVMTMVTGIRILGVGSYLVGQQSSALSRCSRYPALQHDLADGLPRF
ncbi:MAG: hypothetical protein RLZZ336_143 [Cyanobacteriota bacterium]